MLCLNDTDVLEAWASVDAKIDCSIHGLVGTTFTNLYTGTLSNGANTVVYTAGTDVSIVSVSFVNTHNAAITINFKLDPANGGNDKFLLPVAVSLEAGYGLVFDGQRFTVMDTDGNILTGGGGGASISDAAYGAGWNGVTDIGASKNSLYDEIELRAPKASPTFTGIVTAPTINLTGGQIAFPAAAVPSGDPNTIDDYEEGTFGGSGANGILVSVVGTITCGVTFLCSYEKIGSFIHTAGQLTVSGLAGQSGDTTILLPFTLKAGKQHRTTGPIATEGVGYVADYLIGRAVENTAFIQILQVVTNAAYTVLDAANISPTDELTFGINYRVA